MRYTSSTTVDADLQPREKMLAHGAKTLRDDELLAILLGTGIRRGKTTTDVATLARLLMKDFGTRGLFAGFDHPVDLAAAAGLPPVKACMLTAVGELLRRMTAKDRAAISSPDDAAAYFADLRQTDKEHVRVACLTPENLIFYTETAAIGDSASAACPLLNIFNPPVRFYAQRIIIAHNHPRGAAQPSKQDLGWHQELLAAAALLKIEIVDHVIIGAADTYSFAADGLV